MDKLTQAHIVHSEGADPTVDRFERVDARVRIIVVFVPEPAAAVPVCAGAVWAAKVIEATGGCTPVGAVMFGAESLRGAADYGTRYQRSGATP
jgi:hypothetical protein